ncbi:hypothetical protein [Amycolatopsis regifaucium]|uniref:Uncharacterized protein n=1 Tax=Amycolatopsis regifaucium TaxID=546365 RepID=A0ABX3DPB1_9PSEU|nr:hypothetical protein [Amycolatopsis regifaucium]OKA06455.1 hypothetical protein ATP06_0225420 [Amycolatopsis regifaucium]SFJ26669.1 hypothetical protein SAMN04489731_1181 [Amycolatopsis regifaucium]
MAAQGKKKTKAELDAEALGMTVEKLHELKSQVGAAKGRGRRPAGTAGADTKLATWGDVDGQSELFPVESNGVAS